MERLIIPMESVGEISDGYHTFNELYDHRITLFIALCRIYRDLFVTVDEEWGTEPEMTLHKMRPWRSKLHSDGGSFDGWFILGMGRASGEQITYHLPLSRWSETEFAETLDFAPEFDGHTSTDVLARLKDLAD